MWDIRGLNPKGFVWSDSAGDAETAQNGPTSPSTRMTHLRVSASKLSQTHSSPSLPRHFIRITHATSSTKQSAGPLIHSILHIEGPSSAVFVPSARAPGHEPKMRSHGAMKDEEAIDAAKEATRGAVYGAVKWGAFAGILGGIGYLTSPLYRSLTIQFKVYIQMSGMAFGSMVEADSRIRQYEAHVRMQRRIARDRAMWQKFEEEYGNDDDE